MKKVVVLGMIGILSLGALLATGCKKPSAQKAGGNKITIVGSDTMVELTSNWAEAFHKANPAIDISVTGGGSGQGIRQLLDGAIPMCTASRPMKDEELAEATNAKGFTPVQHVMALDGIALIVNPSNKISEVSKPQLKSIFTGTVTDWKEVGVAPEKIELLSRENSSGTYQFFQEHVLENQDYAQSAKKMPATATIVRTVSVDKGAIGYVGLGYAANAAGKVKVLKVKADDKSPAIAPSEATVRDKSYPIARELYFYTHGEASGNVKKFIDFCLSPEGQAIVEKSGFVKVAK